jgi:hypothetical protein
MARIGIPKIAIPDSAPDNRGDITPDNSDEINLARIENATLKAELLGVRERLADTQADRDRLARLLEEALKPRPGLIERIGRAFRNT